MKISARSLAAAAALALLALLPLAAGDHHVSLVAEALIFAVFALGINLLLGHMGYVSFGHAMFMGLGGYLFGIFTVILGWPALLSMAAVLVCVFAIAFLVGLICMRVSRIQFILITLAFGEMFHGLFVTFRALGGTDGMAGLPRPDLDSLGIDLWDERWFYYYVLAAFVAVLVLLHRLVHSPFGFAMSGIRENEPRMTALGYRVAVYKYVAFAISGTVSSLAGMLLSQKISFISPDLMSWTVSGEGLLINFIGGAGYFLGPVVGGLFFVVAKDALSAITDEYMTVFGLTFMLIVVFMKGGLYGIIARGLGRLTRAAAGVEGR